MSDSIKLLVLKTEYYHFPAKEFNRRNRSALVRVGKRKAWRKLRQSSVVNKALNYALAWSA